MGSVALWQDMRDALSDRWWQSVPDVVPCDSLWWPREMVEIGLLWTVEGARGKAGLEDSGESLAPGVVPPLSARVVAGEDVGRPLTGSPGRVPWAGWGTVGKEPPEGGRLPRVVPRRREAFASGAWAVWRVLDAAPRRARCSSREGGPGVGAHHFCCGNAFPNSSARCWGSDSREPQSVLL